MAYMNYYGPLKGPFSYLLTSQENAIEMQGNKGNITFQISEIAKPDLNEQAKLFFKKLDKVT